MIKKLIYLSLLALVFSGCSTEFNLATGKEESLMYGTDKEVAIGDKIAAQIEKQFGLVDDVDMNEKARRALKRLAAVSDRKDIVFVVRILDDDTVNAVSLPGGYIYIFRGLAEKLDTEENFAAVIAHEVGHITARHSIKRIQASYAQLLLQGAAIASQDPNLAYGANAIFGVAFIQYSQQDEFEADRLGVKYMKKAGYNPEAMINVLEILQKEERKSGIQPKSYFRTHPYIPQRIAMIRKEINGYLEFRDYLNVPDK